MARKPDERDEAEEAESALAHIEKALRGLRFGEVRVIVQDGVVVQIERTERKRLVKPNP